MKIFLSWSGDAEKTGTRFPHDRPPRVTRSAKPGTSDTAQTDPAAPSTRHREPATT
ncbi:hypothetical protein ACIQMJ_21485 [Actinosynnema sp. NPDC091369]